MQFDFNVPDLGNLQPITMQRKARLGIGKRVVGCFPQGTSKLNV